MMTNVPSLAEITNFVFCNGKKIDGKIAGLFGTAACGFYHIFENCKTFVPVCEDDESDYVITIM